MSSTMYCQSCRTPLTLDPSLQNLNPQAFKLIADASTSHSVPKTSRDRKTLPKYQQDRLEEYDQAVKHNASRLQSTPSRRGGQKDNPDMSFIMLSQSQLLDPSSTSTPSPSRKASSKKPQVSQPTPSQPESEAVKPPTEETATRIFDILSSRTDIDHPVCTDCTDLLLNGLQKRLSSANRERDAYVNFLRQVNAADVPTEDEVRTAHKQLATAEREEREALKKLEALEKERAEMEAEILRLDEEMAQLDEEEEKFWAERNDMSSRIEAYREERDAVSARAAHDEAMLRRLQRANVYNDTFSIGHDGFFGTINGLRLGRLPDRPVEWAEINAAWGHALLLLDTVANRLGFQFRGYKLVPMGSTSKILEILPISTKDGRKTSGKSAERFKEHELFSTAEYSLSLSLFSRKFDGAMVAFLECLRQLINYAQTTEFVVANPHPETDDVGSPITERSDPNTVDGGRNKQQKKVTVTCPEIPYKIDKDRIGEYSIKLGGFSQEEEGWTKACKAVLICCKFLLAHASNVEEFAAANTASTSD